MALFCSGSTIHGELGIGDVREEHIMTPRKLDWELAEKVRYVSSGSTHSLMITDDGKLFSCGRNNYHQLGHDQPHRRPNLVRGLGNHVITKACCGLSHSIALNEWGNVFTWGSNKFSQLGFPTDNSEPLPKLVKALGTKRIVQIAAGNHHNIALTNEGELFAWGLNHFGQCGLGDAEKISTPTKISSLNGIPIASIACGESHSFLISKSGAVFGFGKNKSGQIGVGDFASRLYPVQLKSLRNVGVCHISAGEDFTVFLTKEGGVLTCGAGNHGQTAHGYKGNEVLPRMVFELMGTICTQVACGSHHCLAFVPSHRSIYGFGLGSSGQLGNRSTSNSLLPQKIAGPWASPNCSTLQESFTLADDSKVPFVKRIFSGGDHSFVATSNSCEKLHDCRLYEAETQIECITLELIEQCAKVGETDFVDLSLMSSTEIIFKSVACVNGSFLSSNGGQCSKKNHGISIENAETAFRLIQTIENQALKNVIWESITTQLLPTLVKSPPDIEALRIYLLLPLYNAFTNVKNYPELHTPFGRSFLGLIEIARKVVLQWWADASVEYFEKLIAHFRNVVGYILNHKLEKVVIGRNHNSPRGLIKIDNHLNTALKVLKLLFDINQSDRNEPIPYENFYVHGLADSVHLQKDFCECNASKNPNDVFLLNYPFLFDAPAKKLILQTDQSLQMCKAAYHSANAPNWEEIFGERLNTHITFTISRDRIVDDTIKELVKYMEDDLKKLLTIKFENEPAQDAGGVVKEFFMLLNQELFKSEYGMFKNYSESRLIWFLDSSFEDKEKFQLVGTLVGLAVYNFQIINLAFPLALYKKILNEPLKLNDLCELSPTIGNSMKSLLDYEGDDMEDVFDLTFEVTREVYDNWETVVLKDNGANIHVNQANKKEFVDLYIDYVFNKSVEKQYTEFYKGFMKVCHGSVLFLFQAHELRDVLIGNENYDWDVFENNTKYNRGYKSSDLTIRLFWKVFHELPLKEKKEFLLFLTGCDRIPLEGMKAIRIVIQPVADDKYLPAAHTCFNLLDLPRYRTENQLKSKLLQAIQHNDHFSLV